MTRKPKKSEGLEYSELHEVLHLQVAQFRQAPSSSEAPVEATIKATNWTPCQR